MPLQLEQAIMFLGFFAWCERREFFLAFDVRLRGTAIVKNLLKLALSIGQLSIFCELNKTFIEPLAIHLFELTLFL